MRLRELREAKGVTQRKAALDLNLSPTVYNRYESGVREPPFALLPVLADYFGVSIDELLGRERPADKQNPNVPKTPEARTLAIGLDKMTQEERERALKIVKMMFEYADYFERNDDDDA